MSRRRSPLLPQRRPIFVGCEGQSEVGYVGLLQKLLRDASLPVHLVIHDLGRGAGDPLARVVLAVQRLEHLRRTRIAPPERFLLLDTDQTEFDQYRTEQAQRLAAEHRLTIVWQRPCFEALLLRHLRGRAMHQPSDTSGARRALEREWPEYRKPMTSIALAQHVNLDAVKRAAATEPELMQFLRCLGLIA